MSSLIGNKPNQIPTNADLGKLAFLNALPTATTSILGGVKVDGTSITITNGVISAIGSSDTLSTITARGATTSTAASFTGGLTVGTSLVVPNSSTLPGSPTAGNLRFNTSTSKFEGYNGSVWGAIAGSGGGLTPTAIKTSAYTAAANDLVRCNTTSGAFSITLPASPTDGDQIGIIDTNNTFTTNNLTVLPNGKTIEGDSTSLILDVSGTYVVLLYVSATNNWKIENTPSPSSPFSLVASTTVAGLVKVDGTTITVNGSGVISASASATKTIVNTAVAYNVTATDLGKIINCTSGTFTVSLTAAATLGSGFTCTIWNTSSTSTDAITIDPAGAETIDGVATLILRRGEGMDIVCNGTNWQTSYKKVMRGYAENMSPTDTRPVATGNTCVAIGNASVASANYAIALAGATASNRAAIAIGGYNTIAEASGFYSSAIGMTSAGDGSKATASGAMALGGSYASGTDSFAAAVANNTSTYGATNTSAIALGALNKATGIGTVAIGNQNTASGNAYGTCLGGYNNTASGERSTTVGGTNNTASGKWSVALGENARANLQGKLAFSVGIFAAQGDAQYGLMVLRAATTTTTAVVLTSDGAAASTNNQIILPNNSVYGFTGTISAMQSAAGGTNFAIWEVKGGIRRGASAAAMTLGSYNINILSKSSGATAWTVALSADTTNGGLAITVTGAASVNIRWVASITTSEVTYA